MCLPAFFLLGADFHALKMGAMWLNVEAVKSSCLGSVLSSALKAMWP